MYSHFQEKPIEVLARYNRLVAIEASQIEVNRILLFVWMNILSREVDWFPSILFDTELYLFWFVHHCLLSKKSNRNSKCSSRNHNSIISRYLFVRLDPLIVRSNMKPPPPSVSERKPYYNTFDYHYSLSIESWSLLSSPVYMKVSHPIHFGRKNTMMFIRTETSANNSTCRIRWNTFIRA